MKRLGEFAATVVSVAVIVTSVAHVAHAQTVILGLNEIRVGYDENSFGRRVMFMLEPNTGNFSPCSPVDPQNVVLVLTLPMDTTFVSEIVSGSTATGVFDPAAQTVTWDFGTLGRFNSCFGEGPRVIAIVDIASSVVDASILQASGMVSTSTAGDDPADNTDVVDFQAGMQPLEVFLDGPDARCSASGAPSESSVDGSPVSCSGGSSGILMADATASVGGVGAPGLHGEITGSGGVVVSPSARVQASADGDFDCDAALTFCFRIGNSAEATIDFDMEVRNPNPFPVPIRARIDAYAHASCGDDAAGFDGDAFIEDSAPSAECGSSFDMAGSSVFHSDFDGGTGICRRYGFTNNDSFDPFDEEFSCSFSVRGAGFSGPGTLDIPVQFGSGDASGGSTVTFFDTTIDIKTGYGRYNAMAQARIGLGGGAIAPYTAAMSIVVHSPVAALLTNEQGERVGFDPSVVNPVLTSDDPFAFDTMVDLGERAFAEIAGGQYSGVGSEPQEITVGLPEPGVYTLDLIGTGAGPFTVDVRTEDADGNILSEESFGGDALPGVTTSQAITLAQGGTVTLDGMPGLGHFLLYDVKVADRDDDGDRDDDDANLVVSLLDQFDETFNSDQSRQFEVKKVKRLGNPAEKTFGDDVSLITDPDTHLVAYKIERVEGEPRHPELTGVVVTNQFGEITLDTEEPELLLVPSLKDLTQPIDNAAVPDQFPVDHFKCYEVEVTEGTPDFVPVQVSVLDQFNQPTLLDVEEPKWLCNPVSKNGAEIGNPDAHLLCYEVERAEGQPEFEEVAGIHTNNQFGPLELEAEEEKELCVPSEKDLTNAVPIPDDDDDA